MWVWIGVLLHYLYSVPPVCLVEVVTQSASSVGRPWAPWEGEIALASDIG